MLLPSWTIYEPWLENLMSRIVNSEGSLYCTSFETRKSLVEVILIIFAHSRYKHFQNLATSPPWCRSRNFKPVLRDLLNIPPEIFVSLILVDHRIFWRLRTRSSGGSLASGRDRTVSMQSSIWLTARCKKLQGIVFSWSQSKNLYKKSVWPSELP